MSFTFLAESTVSARKPHRCEACMSMIDVGTAHSYMRMKFDGDFCTTRQHLECRAAEAGLAALHHLGGGEDWIFLYNLDEPSDLEWVQVNHPAAWERVRHRYQAAHK